MNAIALQGSGGAGRWNSVGFLCTCPEKPGVKTLKVVEKCLRCHHIHVKIEMCKPERVQGEISSRPSPDSMILQV